MKKAQVYAVMPTLAEVLEREGFSSPFIQKLLATFGLLSPSGWHLEPPAPGGKGIAALKALGLVEAVLEPDALGSVRALGDLKAELTKLFRAGFDKPRATFVPGSYPTPLENWFAAAWFYRRHPRHYAQYLLKAAPAKENPHFARLAYEVALTTAGAPPPDALAYGRAIARLHVEPAFFSDAVAVSLLPFGQSGQVSTRNKGA